MSQAGSGKGEGLVEALLGIALVIGAVIVGAAFLDSLTKAKKPTYRCPNCKHDIEEHARACSNCGLVLAWTERTPSER